MSQYAVVAALLAVVVCGCSKPLYLALFNNTGAPLEMCDHSIWRTVPVNSATVFVPSVADDTDFLVSRDGKVQAYSLRGIPIPDRYCSHRKGRVTLHAQIEPNLCVYLVPPGSTRPVTELPAQPPSFPVSPRRVGGSASEVPGEGAARNAD
jgi:hypothetical protein